MPNRVLQKKYLLITAIIFICFSLRAPITSIGPLAGLISDDLGVSNGFVGFMTTLPLIAFAICSPLVPKVSDRLGIGNTMLVGLIVIVLGGVLRAYTGIAGLLAGTALIGVGISAGNVLIPSIVKLNFPQKLGIVTSIYMTSMILMASIGAGASYPMAESGLGWRASTAVWVGFAILGIIAWIPQLRMNGTGKAPRSRTGEGAQVTLKKNIWKSPLAWYITIYNGLQSLNFYSMAAWVPSILHSYGIAPMTAGYMALWFQLVGIGASFLVPILASRAKSQLKIVIISCSAYFAGIVLLILFHSTPMILISLFLLSNGLSASFSWVMSMYSMKTADAEESIKLSGMSQSIGYLLAAVGPTLCGALFDYAQTWSTVLDIFIVTSVIMFLFGILAAKKDKLF